MNYLLMLLFICYSFIAGYYIILQTLLLSNINGYPLERIQM